MLATKSKRFMVYFESFNFIDCNYSSQIVRNSSIAIWLDSFFSASSFLGQSSLYFGRSNLLLFWKKYKKTLILEKSRTCATNNFETVKWWPWSMFPIFLPLIVKVCLCVSFSFFPFNLIVLMMALSFLLLWLQDSCPSRLTVFRLKLSWFCCTCNF